MLVTRGAIAVGTPGHWTGVYQHQNAYPTGLGTVLWEWIQANGVGATVDMLEAHPGGWVNFPEQCCHDAHRGEGSAAADDEADNLEADDSRLDDQTADPVMIKWVYVIDRANMMLHVLESRQHARPGERAFEHQLAGSFDLNGAEPDWERVEWGSYVPELYYG